MAQVVFTEQALADIDEIAQYIAGDSVYYASLQVEKFVGRIANAGVLSSKRPRST